MASLRDAILGLGQWIDGHQVPPVQIHGTTPHDSSTPPPPLDLPYSQTTQSHLHHHPQFSQPHKQRGLCLTWSK
ncbi:hypothetical protein CK203_104559 [Vitis vinifera]|uniref:Uncharacterized protein n=1 Tax=Vitis vinifera TaxID=29760 RepID=A0A438FGK5_VITVI|nr:hypothetical protein CK203_104559 [Vitis vinifera]